MPRRSGKLASAFMLPLSSPKPRPAPTAQQGIADIGLAQKSHRQNEFGLELLGDRGTVATHEEGHGMLRSGELALIERLVAEMTLEEKLGQLTMVSAELIQTGPTSAPITPKSIREGRIGSVLNLWGAERVREVQRLAVEGSRLKIPLFFGLDVVDGRKTIFPIPLGETCAFDPQLWEQTARAAAEETAADGVD